jgi:ATP-dependent DNA ligase
VLTVAAEGRTLFEAAQRLDLEGIVAKRKTDPYKAGAIWYKIKNRAYTQMEARGDLFHGPR